MIRAIAAFCFTATSLAASIHERDRDFVAQKIRTYCQSCHGVGELRFIYSENNDELWQFITTQRAPNSGELWIQRMIRVLDWPSDSAPAFSQPMNPPNEDWMPKGSKRLRLARDKNNGQFVRRIILEKLRAESP